MVNPLRLSKGSHVPGSTFGCTMNVIAWEQGEKISDYPKGVDPVLARIVQLYNDNLCPHEIRTLCPNCAIKALALGHTTTGTKGLFNRSHYKQLAVAAKSIVIECEGAEVMSVSPIAREVFASCVGWSAPLPKFTFQLLYRTACHEFHKWAANYSRKSSIMHPVQLHDARIKAILSLRDALYETAEITPPNHQAPLPESPKIDNVDTGLDADFAAWQKELSDASQ